MSCISSSRSAFLAPFFAPRRSLPALSKSRCTTRRRWVTACASGGPPNESESLVHESWHVYSKPGNLCVICSGRGETCCLYCYGEGTIRIGPETGRDTLSCPQCSGSGIEVCTRCEGSGKRPATRFDLDTMQLVPNLTNEQVCELELPKDVRDTAAADAESVEGDASQPEAEPLQPQPGAATNGVSF